MRNHAYKIILTLLVALVSISCNTNDDIIADSLKGTRTRKIAVFCSKESSDKLKNTAEWALENISKAQSGCSKKIILQLEWHDEDASDIADLAYRISSDPEYSLIIGPEKSAAAYRVAQQVEQRVPMILPIVTSTELQRIYGGEKGLWFLTQSDITQSEILLTQAKLAQHEKVTLLASNDEYGRSFNDWISYQALELGLTVNRTLLYSSESELKAAITQMTGHKDWYRECIIFAPSKASDAIAIDEQIGYLRNQLADHEYLKLPQIYCSDVVASSQIAGRLANYRYEGVSPAADPRTGWASAYRGRFKEEPSNGTAQFYDALLLGAFSIFSQEEKEPLNATILRLVDNADGAICGGWTATELQNAFRSLESGIKTNLRGITSEWKWDKKNHNSVVGTYYAHWVYDADAFKTLEYLTLNGADGSISATQAWEWEKSHHQNFEDTDSGVDYPALKDRFAVVVGASDTWANYRHQADALAIYQLLKLHGYDDDHIILIMEDNIAHNPKNKFPGEIRVMPEGENLYHDVKVDYKVSELTIEDLTDIMTGHKSSRLPEAISPTGNDNVIMFWCGHGSQNTLMWGSSAYVYGADMRHLINGMNDEGRYRKFLFVLDACYSGTIGEACEGVSGLLVFTAAHANETSKADMFDNALNVWLSNGFTRKFREEVDNNPAISFKDLYYKTVRGTIGSHPHIYNASCYGNMYKETMQEFF